LHRRSPGNGDLPIAQCRGEVLITKTNKYCDARYSKSTGTVSEDAENVWETAIEGLVAKTDAPKGSYAEKFFPVTDENIHEYIFGDWTKSTDVFCSPSVVPEETITKYLGRVDETGQYFRWQKKLTQSDMRESLSTRGGITDLVTVNALNPGKRGRSGRLRELEVVYTSKSGEIKSATIHSEYKIRAALSTKFLFSSCFLIDSDFAGDGAEWRDSQWRRVGPRRGAVPDWWPWPSAEGPTVRGNTSALLQRREAGAHLFLIP
ncbi:MAG: hypothetical protein ABI579_05580, partial [Candidatus Sumerlaeota bacterium]